MKKSFFKQIATKIICLAIVGLISFFSLESNEVAYAAGNVVDNIAVDKTNPKIGDSLKVSVRIGSAYGNLSNISEIYANYIPANKPKQSYPLGLYYNSTNGLYEGYITAEETNSFGPGKWLVGSIVIFDNQNKNVAIYNIGQTNTGSKQDLSGGNFTVVAPSGWYSLKGIWYYVDPTTNTLKKGWLSYNGYWYFLDQNGAMKSGWQSIDNHWYYLNAPSGDMQVGWKQLDGKWYYLNNSGVMQTGWVSTGGKWYYFYDSGEMAHDTYVNGYWLGSDGAWVQ
ncbi:hypothetical protein ACFQZ1_13610 [Bacillus sp. CGMCC 1.60114]|uniref:N-acetylmuramoyl-L-alanine amidase family protein n=1 Tax=unclassified Bacillus (in: firmicutes) TaxID=185979 RepID=UPI00362A10DA